MKDLSFFILKNSLSAKMKKGIQSFCNNNASTSTLCQSSNKGSEETRKSRTLEEMIVQLEIEEEEARRSKLDDLQDVPRRMSCVDSIDIMKSARNALNQYPRFSLDGRDAMYRSSFRNFVDGRKSFCGGGGRTRMPPTLAGERVVWCKPGVVAKLMGLDAVPVPVGREGGRFNNGGFLSKKENLRRMGKLELEKERISLNLKSRKGMSREDLDRCLGLESVHVHSFVGKADWQIRRTQ
ncbi:hypothetical protein KFK09_016738 [Dendrobium nobile]|uniref:DUF3741 domain-containing protein n=1 Tax=Dendrobium nobile TaxID=94219 RepID=A0A8T3AZ33_DENNO|nr:hypothetical protein KFK09_016738 [Dendrobium nobile]